MNQKKQEIIDHSKNKEEKEDQDKKLALGNKDVCEMIKQMQENQVAQFTKLVGEISNVKTEI